MIKQILLTGLVLSLFLKGKITYSTEGRNATGQTYGIARSQNNPFSIKQIEEKLIHKLNENLGPGNDNEIKMSQKVENNLLFWSAKHGKTDLFKVLFKNRESIRNLLDENNNTLLMIAASHGHLKITEEILNSPEYSDTNGQSAIDAYDALGESALAKVLLNINNPKIETNDSHFAISYLLIKKGASVTFDYINGQKYDRTSEEVKISTRMKNLIKQKRNGYIDVRQNNQSNNSTRLKDYLKKRSDITKDKKKFLKSIKKNDFDYFKEALESGIDLNSNEFLNGNLFFEIIKHKRFLFLRELHEHVVKKIGAIPPKSLKSLDVDTYADLLPTPNFFKKLRRKKFLKEFILNSKDLPFYLDGVYALLKIVHFRGNSTLINDSLGWELYKKEMSIVYKLLDKTKWKITPHELLISYQKSIRHPGQATKPHEKKLSKVYDLLSKEKEKYGELLARKDEEELEQKKTMPLSITQIVPECEYLDIKKYSAQQYQLKNILELEQAIRLCEDIDSELPHSLNSMSKLSNERDILEAKSNLITSRSISPGRYTQENHLLAQDIKHKIDLLMARSNKKIRTIIEMAGRCILDKKDALEYIQKIKIVFKNKKNIFLNQLYSLTLKLDRDGIGNLTSSDPNLDYLIYLLEMNELTFSETKMALNSTLFKTLGQIDKDTLTKKLESYENQVLQKEESLSIAPSAPDLSLFDPPAKIDEEVPPPPYELTSQTEKMPENSIPNFPPPKYNPEDIKYMDNESTIEEEEDSRNIKPSAPELSELDDNSNIVFDEDLQTNKVSSPRDTEERKYPDFPPPEYKPENIIPTNLSSNNIGKVFEKKNITSKSVGKRNGYNQINDSIDVQDNYSLSDFPQVPSSNILMELEEEKEEKERQKKEKNRQKPILLQDNI